MKNGLIHTKNAILITHEGVNDTFILQFSVKKSKIVGKVSSYRKNWDRHGSTTVFSECFLNNPIQFGLDIKGLLNYYSRS